MGNPIQENKLENTGLEPITPVMNTAPATIPPIPTGPVSSVIGATDPRASGKFGGTGLGQDFGARIQPVLPGFPVGNRPTLPVTPTPVTPTPTTPWSNQMMSETEWRDKYRQEMDARNKAPSGIVTQAITEPAPIVEKAKVAPKPKAKTKKSVETDPYERWKQLGRPGGNFQAWKASH